MDSAVSVSGYTVFRRDRELRRGGGVAVYVLSTIEACVEELISSFPAANIVLAGDVNQLSDEDMEERTGLTQLVHQPTGGVNILDRVYVSSPQTFNIIRVMSSIVRSDHKAVVAFLTVTQCTQPKSTFQCTFRRKSPTQHALFLQHAADMTFVNPQPSASSDQAINTQVEFKYFYSTILGLVNQFYPEQIVCLDLPGRRPKPILPRTDRHDDYT